MSVDHTPSGVPLIPPLGSDFISGAVSLARLLSIYGYEYMEEVDALWATEGTDFIVLFTNDAENEYALLPVGPAHPHKSLAKALELTAGGLHAVCHAAAGDGVKPVPLTLPTDGWKKISRAFPSEAEAMEKLIVNAGTHEEALLAVLRRLTETMHELNAARTLADAREQELADREAHVLASARRIEELMQRYGRWEDLIAQTALLEQREKYVQEVESRLILRAQQLEIQQEELDQANANLDRRAARATAADATRTPISQ